MEEDIGRYRMAEEDTERHRKTGRYTDLRREDIGR